MVRQFAFAIVSFGLTAMLIVTSATQGSGLA